MTANIEMIEQALEAIEEAADAINMDEWDPEATYYPGYIELNEDEYGLWTLAADHWDGNERPCGGYLVSVLIKAASAVRSVLFLADAALILQKAGFKVGMIFREHPSVTHERASEAERRYRRDR